MQIPDAIADRLRNGCSNSTIIREFGVSKRFAAAARRDLGVPSYGPGRPTTSTPQGLFRDRTEQVTGGHLRWTGTVTNAGVPSVSWLGRNLSAYRIAFVMRHNRAPVGLVRPGCGYPRCVAPAHVEDQAMRDQLRAQMAGIFGGAA
ncbi:hypothetical protein ACFC34_00355 [Streptomyces sp. NPDC056053]|uniref:hypothetical protein n=1 Tax=Streptomyces sp. NPDC056053 TaxID=3345696 RepID=UPI0035DF8177